MSGRSVRLSLLLLLAASAVGSSVVLLVLERENTSRITAYADATVALAELSDTVAGVGAAQQAYVAPGQPFLPWFERGSVLLEQLPPRVERVKTTVRAPQAAGALAALSGSLDPITKTDARARQNLQLGQDLMAADVVFSDGRSLVEGMMAAIARVQSAERVDMEASLRSIALGRWIVLGVMVALLGVCVVVLSRQRDPQADREGARYDSRLAIAPFGEERPSVEPSSQPDMIAVARLCTEFSKVTSRADLDPLLQGVVDLLDAKGLVVWLDTGESLVPVAARGYHEEALARMGPVARSDGSAVAEAWRRAEPISVAATPPGTGALVVPLLGTDTCVGALAVELAAGREDDVSTRAITTLFAAQLAPLVSVASSDNPGRALSA